MDITRNGTLCNADGEIGTKEFETIMRKEVTTYLQTRLTDFSDFRTSEDIEFTQLGAVKTILSEVLLLVEEQRAARQEMKNALDQMRQGPPESPIPQNVDPLQQPLAENGLGSSTTKVIIGTDAAKALQASMEALVAELVGVKTVIQEHAADLRRTLPLSAQRPSALSVVNSIPSSLDVSSSERRRRPPRRDWGSFVLAGSGSGRNTETTSVSPAAPAGSLVRATPPIKIPGSPVCASASGRYTSQDCVSWSAPNFSRTTAGDAVVAVSTLRQEGGMRGGKKPAAVVPGIAADRTQQWKAAAQAPAPLEISAPTLLAAEKSGALQLAGTLANDDNLSAPSGDALHTQARQSAATTEAVSLAASPVLKGGSKLRQVESEVVLVPSPAVAVACYGDRDEPIHSHYGSPEQRAKQPPGSNAAAGWMSLGITGPADSAAAVAPHQQPWIESELVVATQSGDSRPAAPLPASGATLTPGLRTAGDSASNLPSAAASNNANGAAVRLPTQGPSAFQPPARRRAASEGSEPQGPVASANGPPKPSLRRPIELMSQPPSP